MRRPSCSIYGFDGLDLDIVHNLVPFYRALGMEPVLTKRLAPADLLVMQRPPDRPVDVREFAAVHVWDYVGNPISRLITESPGAERITVFTASEARARDLAAASASSGATVQVLVAPVHAPTWAKRLGRTDFDSVHIGNYKPYYREGGDGYAQGFLAALHALRGDVWGNGWTDPALSAHGPLALFRVSSVYARSTVALGMMYPHQRPISFSGRFWHAPLNGCALLSEPSVYADLWPGVYGTDYTAEDVRGRLDRLPDRHQVQQEAREFWDDHWRRALETVRAVVSLVDTRRAPVGFVDLARSNGRLLVHRTRR